MAIRKVINGEAITLDNGSGGGSITAAFDTIYLPRTYYTTDNYGRVSIDFSTQLPTDATIVSATQIYESYMGTKDALPVAAISGDAKGVVICGFDAGASVLVGLYIIYKTT